MLFFPYDCPGCGCHSFKPKSWFMNEGRCPKCGVILKKSFMDSFFPNQRHNAVYQKPIEMFAVAPETPAQLAELRRQLPDTKFTPDLVPIAHSFAERNRILKATGFEDRSGRG